MRRHGVTLGTIFVNPGGPGGSGLEMLYRLAMEQKLGGLTPRFDIVGFDPRGVGASLPMIRCQSSAAMDAERYGSDGLSSENLMQSHNTMPRSATEILVRHLVLMERNLLTT